MVDKFLLFEGDKTFSGLPRQPRFDAADPRLRAFLPRIRHMMVTDVPEANNAWEREYHQRNAVVRGLWEAAPEDLVLLSDLDEIPRAWTVAFSLHSLGAGSSHAATVADGSRAGRIAAATLPRAGWHFSHMIDAEGVRRTIREFSHQEFNTPEFLGGIDIDRFVRARTDKFGDARNVWDILDDKELPAFVLADQSVF